MGSVSHLLKNTHQNSAYNNAVEFDAATSIGRTWGSDTVLAVKPSPPQNGD